jgi:hypothetical protein
METTVNLDLPYIMPAQAQKHVTHNEALRMLDALVQLSVASRGLSAAPMSPAEGERHIVDADANGAWDGWDGDVAVYVDGAWMRLTPLPGWRAWVEDESSRIARAPCSSMDLAFAPRQMQPTGWRLNPTPCCFRMTM